MEKVLLSLCILFAGNCFAQQKDNLFVSAELNKTRGLSLVYNRLLPGSKFGLGPGLEFIDVGTKKLGGIMPGIDLRYYSKFGKSTILPLAQAGYNFYSQQYQKLNASESYEYKGGFSYSLGLGYSYSLNEKGSGPFAAFKFRSLQYKYTDPLLPKTTTQQQLKISIGWRF